MTWFKIDDSFHDHPKLHELTLDPEMWAKCVSLWTVAGSYSSRHATDGVLKTAWVASLVPFADASTVADELVRAGLWRRVAGGYAFHDWEDYNPTKADLAEARKLKTERQRRWREARRRKRAGAVDPSVDGTVDASTDASRDGPLDASVDRLVDGTVDGGEVRLVDGDPTHHRARRVDGAPSRPVPSRDVLSTRPRVAKGMPKSNREPAQQQLIITTRYEGMDPAAAACADELARHRNITSVVSNVAHLAEKMLGVAPALPVEQLGPALVDAAKQAASELPERPTDALIRRKLRTFAKNARPPAGADSGSPAATAADVDSWYAKASGGSR